MTASCNQLTPSSQFFFAGGLILTALLGMVVLGYFALGWRWYLFIVAIMALLSLPLYWVSILLEL